MTNDIVRSICYFTDSPGREVVDNVNSLAIKLINKGYEVQTKRICSPFESPKELEERIGDATILLGVGPLFLQQALHALPDFYQAEQVPDLTFNFAFVFNNRPSSPYFPSAAYDRNGFSIGLEPTDLAENCVIFQEWLGKMKDSWVRLHELFLDHHNFLGIDSSIAPAFAGKGSLINFIKRLGLSFNESVTSDIYLSMTDFLKKHNPKPVGLCGLMLPCLEDFELAEEYEQGNFSVERNIFLSLHSGLGVDTYPIGIDEDPKRVLEVLRLMQGLSNKYQKPLSCRFVSDGEAKIGGKTDFQNPYLKDVVVKKL